MSWVLNSFLATLRVTQEDVINDDHDHDYDDNDHDHDDNDNDNN